VVDVAVAANGQLCSKPRSSLISSLRVMHRGHKGDIYLCLDMGAQLKSMINGIKVASLMKTYKMNPSILI